MDLTAALFGDEAAALTGVPMSLPALVQSSIFKVYSEHGAQAARSMVMNLRRLQEQARTAAAAHPGEQAAARERALHAEQIGIVLRVFGDDVVLHVIDAVRTDLTGLEDRLPALGNGEEGSAVRARDLIAQVAELLTDAEAAAEAGARRAGLDAATRAAALTESVRGAFAESLRLHGLEDLFSEAQRRTRELAGADVLRGMNSEMQRLKAHAQDAVRSGDRQRAHEALAAVRSEQIRIVIDVLGAGAVRGVLDAADESVVELRTTIAAAKRSGRDVARLERMLASARDMLIRAEDALTEADAAAALDLGSHAVGMINALRLAVGSR